MSVYEEWGNRYMAVEDAQQKTAFLVKTKTNDKNKALRLQAWLERRLCGSNAEKKHVQKVTKRSKSI